jgi:uncharacterized protein (TIGR04255 family)
VELIAELRWGSGGVLPAGQPQGAGPILLALSGQHEEFFMRFGSGAGAIGYNLVERVIPHGLPALPFQQVIYRFRRKDQEQGTSVYQVGDGLFSANITPPYRYWEDFKPVLEKGVELLLETRHPSEKEMPFTTARVRYINAFGSRFTEGRSTAAFLREVLGFGVELPTPVRDEIAPDKEAKPALQLIIPLKTGLEMNLTLTEGLVSGQQAVVMDLTVSNEAQTQPTKTNVMAVFETAHEVAHRVFVGTTKKLSHIMELIEGDET